MKLRWCTLTVKDMEASLRFYQEIVGLYIRRSLTAWPDVEIVFLGDGGDEIELIYDPKTHSPVHAENISLAFEVKSVDTMMQFVKEKGYEIEGGPYQPNPYIRFFYVRDPNGILIQFVEKLYVIT